jgi:hypothetical protein
MQYDVLQFVDPLIGTANGGESLTHPSALKLTQPSISHTLNRPCLPRRHSPLR